MDIDIFQRLSRKLLDRYPEDETGRMLQSPGLKTGGKFYAFATGEALVIKLPAARAADLIAEGVGRACEPRRGRPMRQWVHITTVGEKACTDYLMEAREYVASLRNDVRSKSHAPVMKGTAVTDKPSPALDTAIAYHRAWTSHHFDQAMTYVAEEIVCDAPAGRFEGAESFRAFMEPFVRILTDSTLIAAFGDDKTALLMYDTETLPVRNAPGAECLTVEDGTITYIRIVFDRAPFDAARKTAG